MEFDTSWVSAPRWAPLPGYVHVVARTHVAEHFELGGLERRRYWEEILMVAKAVREVTEAAKVNYEIHGNTIPHLHMHLYPRVPGDPFEGRPIEGAARLFERSSSDIERLADAVRRVATATRGGSGRIEATAVYEEMAAWFERQSATSFYAYYDRPAVLDVLGEVAGQRVLDVGCGPGHYLAALADRGAHVVGIDGSVELLRRARARVGEAVELIHHDLNLPLSMLDDDRFDLAVLALVYHHVDNRPGLLGELRRVLKRGGRLVLSTSHPVSDWLAFGGNYLWLRGSKP